MRRQFTRVCVTALLAVAALSCRQDDRQVVPNRVLDRPLDLALTCMQRRSDGSVEVLALNQCNSAGPGSCPQRSTGEESGPQLIGFVANSERNEVAMFRRCDTQQAVVDLDADAPGHQLVPVGQLPSRLTRTADSCRVVTANVGSCDFSVLDTTGLGAYALGTPPDVPASGLVSSVQPRRSDGTLLGAAPGDILAVPSALSLAANSASEFGDDAGQDTGGGGDDAGPDTTGGSDDGGTDEPVAGLVCASEISGSVYTTFPACQLVAEIDLATGRVLQSRRLVTVVQAGVETVVVEDAGTNPVCPIECPGQFEGALPSGTPPVDPAGVFPGTLALITPPGEATASGGPDDVVDYAALFVGGTGSDTIVEIGVDEGIGFVDADDAVQMQLESAQGVQAIRVTPPGDVLDGVHQYLFVIAGDGSSRVVDRDFLPDAVGIECDTQVDPTQVANSSCHPIDPNLVGNAPERRAFVAGPGIRAEGGATITDWAFFRVEVELQDADPNDAVDSPFSQPGLVGVGATSFGLLTYVNFGQLSNGGATVPSVDPVGLMDTEVRPFALWPLIDPQTAAPEALPTLADDDPGRGLGGDAIDSRILSPTLRRIDLAYSVPADASTVSEEQQEIARNLFTPATGSMATADDRVANVDQLGGFEESGLYENAPPRVNVRDYVQWRPQTWSVEWEGAIPGSNSPSGLVQCDDHGGVDDSGASFAGGTCRTSTPGDTRIVDESASLCDEGVLPGDKVVLAGCTNDDNCGLGQRCLRAASGPASATGICISEQDYEANLDELRSICAPFIADPCGIPLREYRITRAFQHELWLQPIDVRERAVVREVDGALVEWEAKLSCAAPVPHRDDAPCTADAQCQDDPYDPGGAALGYVCEIADNASEGRCRPLVDTECIDDADCGALGRNYICVDDTCQAPCNLCAPDGPQPIEACVSDADCEAVLGDGHTCFAGTCHQPCADDSPGCIEAPLPGPRCFPEFVSYSVRLKDAFKIDGTSSPFFTDAVSADPGTGECIEDPTVSTLLTSRLRLGADEAETFGHPVWGIPDCPSPLQASPSDPNPCRITGSRGDNPASLFHSFTYQGARVEAIRFSNPFMSVVIDLTSLLDLARPDPETDLAWPAAMAGFRRSRIPRGYREEFGTRDGYIPFDEVVAIGNSRIVYPARVIAAPEPGVVYVVDAGSLGGFSPRGQVMRVQLGDQVLADTLFRVQ